MTLRPSRPSPAMLVAILALVVAMSGSAVAVSAARHSGDKLISKRSLSGNRLRHNTVTGKEVSEKRLGQVPRASLATHVPPLVWHNFTLMYDWTNYNAPRRVPGYAVDVQGVGTCAGRSRMGRCTCSRNCRPRSARPRIWPCRRPWTTDCPTARW